ncbi:MAG: hypothetical protein WAK84_15255 [Candidatus Cybelea sp.]
MYSTPSLYLGANCARFLAFGIVAALFALALLNAEVAQAQTAAGIAAAVDKTCAVMSGERKLDSQTLQLLQLLDEDLADPNPVAIALYRGVIHQCPKAYLAYEQRKRVNNPFANSGLVKGTPAALISSGSSSTSHALPSVFAMRCVGNGGMASAQGATLTVKFQKTEHPASQGLLPGQCSWLDRGVRPNEPSRIEVPLASAGQAQNGVAQINAGGTWTFWVYNTNAVLRATAVAKGTPAKP